MRKTLSCVMAAALALTSLAIPAAQSAPLTSVPAAAQTPNAVTDVQYYHYPRGYRGGGYGYRDRYYHRQRRNEGAAVAAGVVGLAAGVLAAQALSQPRYASPPAYYGGGRGSDWYAYCSSRYRSFDPRSGTYLGYDGRRHYCR